MITKQHLTDRLAGYGADGASAHPGFVLATAWRALQSATARLATATDRLARLDAEKVRLSVVLGGDDVLAAGAAQAAMPELDRRRYEAVIDVRELRATVDAAADAYDRLLAEAGEIRRELAAAVAGLSEGGADAWWRDGGADAFNALRLLVGPSRIFTERAAGTAEWTPPAA